MPECDACRLIDSAHRQELRQVVNGQDCYVVQLETLCRTHSALFWAPRETVEARAKTFTRDLLGAPVDRDA